MPIADIIAARPDDLDRMVDLLGWLADEIDQAERRLAAGEGRGTVLDDFGARCVMKGMEIGKGAGDGAGS